MTKYKCRFCSKLEATVTDSGESYDGGDDWYDMLCKSCGKTWTHWVEHD